MKKEGDKILGLRLYLERKVKYIAQTQDMAESDVWKLVYDIALRELTIIYGL